MAVSSLFNQAAIEAIARLLADCGSGSDIDCYLANSGLIDDSGHSTKWRRLNAIFIQTQIDTQSANQILAFIKCFISFERFIGREPDFEEIRNQLNRILVLHGLEYTREAEFKIVSKAKTLSEAERRCNSLTAALALRKVHYEIYKYCHVELLQDNYFHALFEACKGLFQRIRDISGKEEDGTKLIDVVFSVDKPILAFNTLSTETEKSEHKGYAQLLKGCAMSFRNPLAHGPKILWDEEEHVVDYLCFISMLHKRLDMCFKTGY